MPAVVPIKQRSLASRLDDPPERTLDEWALERVKYLLLLIPNFIYSVAGFCVMLSLSVFLHILRFFFTRHPPALSRHVNANNNCHNSGLHGHGAENDCGGDAECMHHGDDDDVTRATRVPMDVLLGLGDDAASWAELQDDSISASPSAPASAGGGGGGDDGTERENMDYSANGRTTGTDDDSTLRVARHNAQRNVIELSAQARRAPRDAQTQRRRQRFCGLLSSARPSADNNGWDAAGAGDAGAVVRTHHHTSNCSRTSGGGGAGGTGVGGRVRRRSSEGALGCFGAPASSHALGRGMAAAVGAGGGAGIRGGPVGRGVRVRRSKSVTFAALDDVYIVSPRSTARHTDRREDAQGVTMLVSSEEGSHGDWSEIDLGNNSNPPHGAVGSEDAEQQDNVVSGAILVRRLTH